LGERAPTKNKVKRKNGMMRKYVRKMEDGTSAPKSSGRQAVMYKNHIQNILYK
jgi:hypothetical protein